MVSGQISVYNAAETPAIPAFLHLLINKRVTIRGFQVSEFSEQAPRFWKDMASWLKEGKIKHRETVTQGFENLPKVFIGLFAGQNIGKALVVE